MSGCIVTIDAMGCQKKIARQIVSQEADYVLAVKENQGRLLEDVEDLFSCGQRTGFEDMKHDFCQTLDKTHERIETRRCWTIDDPEQLSSVATGKYWPGLRSIGMVTAERRQRDRVSVESRYYISSLESDAKRLLQATRSHWGIENRVHWVLDLSFREDESRVRTGNASENLAIIRHMALTSCGKTGLPKPLSKPGANWPAGTMTTSCPYFAIRMRLPCSEQLTMHSRAADPRRALRAEFGHQESFGPAVP